ncbi:MAG: hypothetical protein U0528_08875 [Anaerolineae bacterium]|nr:hypothetical protein [Anaerolineae bacterium]
MRDLSFDVAGLSIKIKPLFFVASAFSWAALTIAAMALLNLPLTSGIIAGLLATIAHWVGAFVHQLGHAIFARQTGYPMQGIDFGTMGGFLSSSVYPSKEPMLPDAVHLQRALGGPFLSLQVTFIGALMVLAQAEGVHGAAWFASVFFVLENLFIYTLQAAIPLGFNDGEVIWRVLRKQRN